MSADPDRIDMILQQIRREATAGVPAPLMALEELTDLAAEIVRLRAELATVTKNRDHLRQTVELLEWRAAP